jgi:hypothetical protein
MTDARSTQQSLEEWAMPNADAWATQLAAEVWANALAGPRQAILSQIALEEWALATTALSPRQCAVTVSAA